MPTPGKFGRRPNDPSKPRLYLDDYFSADEVAAKLPPFNPNAGAVVASWPMYMNGPDPAMPPGVPAAGLGDCTFAYCGHAIQAVTARAGQEITVTNEALLTGYSAVGGYVVGEESTDQGCQIQDVLNYLRTTGIQLPDGSFQKILGFGALRSWSAANLNAALQLFWTVDLGINFPDSAMTQFNAGQPWTPVPGSQIDGGHCIDLASFKPGMDELEPVTWGALWSMNQAFNREYTEEAWVPIFPQIIPWWEAHPGVVNTAALFADFQALTGEPFPALRMTTYPGTYPPYAEITRLGRWTYGIDIVDGLASMSHPWHTLGRHRAERKARRMLAWYTREGRTADERWTIR